MNEITAHPRSVIVTGPQGSGKAMHAAAIAATFGLSRIVDEWDGGLVGFDKTGTLYLTHLTPCELNDANRTRVITINEALQFVELRRSEEAGQCLQANRGSPDSPRWETLHARAQFTCPANLYRVAEGDHG